MQGPPLCVQGCTLEEGIDFDQTFSAALRYSSARGLFCYAARKGCKVRSINYVAAYLQGKFIEGEVIYCHMPPGYVELDSDGTPRMLKIVKPITNSAGWPPPSAPDLPVDEGARPQTSR
jgi:hypothetical protein